MKEISYTCVLQVQSVVRKACLQLKVSAQLKQVDV